MSIRSLAKQRSWSLVTPLLPALMASCSLDVAGIQQGSSVSSGEGSTSPTASAGQGMGGMTASSGETPPSSGGMITTSGVTTPPADHCGVGSIDEIYDSFDDDVTNVMFWTAFAEGSKGETSIAESGGAVNATSNGAKDLNAGYYQIAHPRRLNNCRAFIEARQVANPAQPVSTFFQLLDDSQGDNKKSFYNINQLRGRLYFNVTINGKLIPSESKDIPYDPAEHHWWRFRENQGTSYMETSRDGQTWATQVTFGTPPFALNVRVKFGMGATEPGASATGAVFDNLNVPPPP